MHSHRHLQVGAAVKVRCIYCQRNLTVNPKGTMPSHVTAGNQKCIAIGSLARTHTNHAKQLNEAFTRRA